MSPTVHRDFSEGVDPAVVRSHVSDLQRAQTAAKSAQASARNARKRMKDGGIDLAAFDLATSLAKLDPAEAVIRLNRAYFYLKSIHAPVGAQLGFHDLIDPNDPVSDEERAARWTGEGSNAFLSGKRETDCPYSAELPAAQAWLTGFREAEGETKATKTAEELKQPNPVDDVAPKRGRGRPPKAKPTLMVDNGRVESPDDGETPLDQPADLPTAGLEPEGDLPPPPPFDDAFLG